MLAAQIHIDHLVLAATTLEQGAAFIEARLGVPPQAGGNHARMGTHNALLRLGDRTYLEIIAIDPEGGTPFQPRWFGLDDPHTRESLAEKPRLLTWVARSDDIASTLVAGRAPLGRIEAMARGDFRWRISLREDGQLVDAGATPALIQWDVPFHPCDRLADRGCRLQCLILRHPVREALRARLDAMGLQDALEIETASGHLPAVEAVISTPQGDVRL
jgi:hypothetical protein